MDLGTQVRYFHILFGDHVELQFMTKRFQIFTVKEYPQVGIICYMNDGKWCAMLSFMDAVK